MPTGIEPVDSVVEGSKNVAADVKSKWRMKIAGVCVALAGLVVKSFSSSENVKNIGIGVIVVGVIMILGTGGCRWVFKTIQHIGKSSPTAKV